MRYDLISGFCNDRAEALLPPQSIIIVIIITIMINIIITVIIFSMPCCRRAAL